MLKEDVWISGKQVEWCRNGVTGGDLTRCHSCELPQLYEALGLTSVCLRAYDVKGIKGKISFFLKLCFSYTVAHFHGIMRAGPMVAGEG